MSISKKNIIIIASALLVAALIGCILVINNRKSDVLTECNRESEKYECWRDGLNKKLKNDGLAASFEVLSDLYNSQPDFAAECHGFTHELGEKTYDLFSQNIKIDITPKASYCGYGFYHGFMEALLHKGGSIDLAKKFCADIDQQLSFFGDKTFLACYHGIGHGAVDGSDPRSFGDPQKLIQPGLEICRTVSTASIDVHQCGTGVFNALALALNSNSFGLEFNSNPYYICGKQSLEFQKSCYEQMNTRVAYLSGGDFTKAAKFLEEINNDENSIIAMEQLAPSMIVRKVGQGSDYKDEVKSCQSLTPRLIKACIRGLVGGILEFGKPDYEYEEAIEFCVSLMENKLEKDTCFERLATSLEVLYSKEKALEICGKIDPEYQKSCGIR